MGTGKPLRLWPGVMIVTVQWFLRFGLPVIAPDALLVSVMGGFGGGVAILLWWLFFSRAAWVERLGAIVLMVAGVFGALRIADKSIATGAMGLLLPILSIPILSLALVVWAVATRNLTNGMRRATMAATLLLASASLTLVRTGGF